MLKRIAVLCVLIMLLVLVPIDALASSGQSVGAVGWDGDGVVVSSVTITFNTPFQDFSSITPENKERALRIFYWGNRLYHSDLLRGKSIIMSVYLPQGKIEGNPEIAGTIYIKNLYQDNQEIVGYSSVISTPR